MRKSLIFSALLGGCLALLAFGANATQVNVDLSGCGGFSSCTTGGVTFTGWQGVTPGGPWTNVNLTYKGDSGGETGLGVQCTPSVSPSGPKCGQHEINTLPPQYIAVDLSGIHFSTLSLGVGSVDGGGPGPEQAGIFTGTCANVGSCGVTEIGQYTFNGTTNVFTFTFAPSQLEGFIYVTPLSGAALDANILLASLTYDTVSVPEPSELGLFGLGLVGILLLVWLRRRQAH